MAKRILFRYVLSTLLLLTAIIQAADFSYGIYSTNDAEDAKYTLTFGLTTGVPQIGPMAPGMSNAVNYIYIKGGGAIDDPLAGWFEVLGSDIRDSTPAATWEIPVEGATKDWYLKKRSASGNLPAGAELLLLDKADLNTVICNIAQLPAEGAKISLETGKEYLIRYRESGTDWAPEAPPSKEFTMLRQAGGTLVLDLAKPVGYNIEFGPSIIGFEMIDGNDVETAIAGENFGQVDANFLTYTLPEDFDGKTPLFVQLQYQYTKDGIESNFALIKIKLEVGISANLTDKNAITKDPGNEANEIVTPIETRAVFVDSSADDYIATELIHKVTFGETLEDTDFTVTVNFPNKTNAGIEPFPYTIVENSFQVKIGNEDWANAAVVPDRPADKPQFTFSRTSIDTDIQIKFRVKLLSNDGESDYVLTTIDGNTADTVETTLSNVLFFVLSGATLDFDNDGNADLIDVLLLYNFIAADGVLYPDDVDVDTLDFGVGSADPEYALDLFKSVPQFLDFDKNGVIELNDVLLLYNFITGDGILYLEDIDVDTLNFGAGSENPEAALEFFRQQAPKYQHMD
jgi:hypothetical protein